MEPMVIRPEEAERLRLNDVVFTWGIGAERSAGAVLADSTDELKSRYGITL